MSDEKRNEDETKDEISETEEVSGEKPSAEDDDGAEDAANPEAIARRVAALGEEDEVEKIAREEERKLAERRAATKKKGGAKKGGLERAASKKLSKIGKRAEPKRTVAVAADADPLIERTAKLSDWAKKNQKVVQIFGAALALGLLGTAGWLWYDNKRETEASGILTKAVEAQTARIGEPPKEEDDNTDPFYKTFDDRRAAALGKYREVQTKFPGTGAAILSRLAEGSMLLDKHEADAAIKAFSDVKASPLAAADLEVKGRAMEGLGFAYELKALATPAEAAKYNDDALKEYRELENTVDVKGFKELAMYHQARVLEKKGEKDKAKEILLSIKERVNKPEDAPMSGLASGPSFPYLREVAMDRLRELDPSAAPKEQHAPGGASQLTPAQIQKLIQQQQQKQKGGHP